MEPRGCNRWQPIANPPRSETAETRATVAVGCDQLRKGAHGKEGVSGSSPEEGSAKAPHKRGFLCALIAFVPGRSFVEPFLELSDVEAEFNPPKTGAYGRRRPGHEVVVSGAALATLTERWTVI